MRTPAAYNNNLKNHIITIQMLVDCLYSSNKRAKNWRDKQREYRERRSYYYDKYDNEGKAKEKKVECKIGNKQTLQRGRNGRYY